MPFNALYVIRKYRIVSMESNFSLFDPVLLRLVISLKEVNFQISWGHLSFWGHPNILMYLIKPRMCFSVLLKTLLAILPI